MSEDEIDDLASSKRSRPLSASNTQDYTSLISVEQHDDLRSCACRADALCPTDPELKEMNEEDQACLCTPRL